MKSAIVNNKIIAYSIVIIILSSLGFYFRSLGLQHVGGDMIECLIPWYEEITPTNGIKSLLNYTGNYGMPYVTILWFLHFIPGETHIKIKAVSIIFEYLCAVGVGLISSHFYDNKKKPLAFLVGFGITILYPVLIIDGAFGGQCDGIYSAFVLFMIFALLNDKPALASGLFGCALAFKFQAVFLFPFLILFFYRRRRFSLLNFLLVPITIEVLYIPAIIAGYSPLSPITIYLKQAEYYPQMYMYYPGLWSFFWRWSDYLRFHIPAICFVLTAYATILLILRRRDKDISDKNWIEIAFFTSFIAVYFLPSMHERYGILSELLAIVYAIMHPKRIWISLSLWAAVTWTMVQPLFMGRWPEHATFGAILLAIIIVLVLFLAYDLKTDNTETILSDNFSFRFKFERITTPEAKFLQIFDKKIHIFVYAVIFLAFLYSARCLISVTAPDYINEILNVDGANTPLYMFIISILNTTGQLIGINTYYLLKIINVGSYIPATLLWGYIISDYKPAKSSFPIAYLLLPSTTMYSVIITRPYGICLFFTGIGLLALKKLQFKSDNMLYIIVSGLSFGVSMALYPTWIIFIMGIFFMKTADISYDRNRTYAKIILCTTCLIALSTLTIAITPMYFNSNIWSYAKSFTKPEAILSPMCSLAIMSVYKNRRHLSVLLFMEYSVLMFFGKNMDIVENDLWKYIPLLIIISAVSLGYGVITDTIKARKVR